MLKIYIWFFNTTSRMLDKKTVKSDTFSNKNLIESIIFLF